MTKPKLRDRLNNVIKSCREITEEVTNIYDEYLDTQKATEFKPLKKSRGLFTKEVKIHTGIGKCNNTGCKHNLNILCNYPNGLTACNEKT